MNKTSQNLLKTFFFSAFFIFLPMGNALAADIEVGIISDLQYRPESANLSNLKAFVNKMKTEKPDFAIELGDFIEGRDLKNEHFSSDIGVVHFKKVRDEFRKLPRTHYVLGNHELLSLKKSNFRSLTAKKKAHYSFDKNGYRFIILDVQFNNEKDVTPDTRWNSRRGSLPEDQLAWLGEKLQTDKKVVIFTHQPLTSIRNSTKVRRLLKENKEVILAVVAGHDSKAKKTKKDGITHYTIPALFKGEYSVLKISNKKLTVHNYKIN